MKKYIALALSLFCVLMLAGCSNYVGFHQIGKNGSDSGNTSKTKYYGYLYPINVFGENAVWWWEVEGYICKEPEVQNGDAGHSTSVRIVLDLYKRGLSGLAEYFQQIEAFGYERVEESYYNFNASQWKINSWRNFKGYTAQWIKHEKPYDNPYTDEPTYYKYSTMTVSTLYDGQEWTGLSISYFCDDISVGN